jgi:hypothetical protein
MENTASFPPSRVRFINTEFCLLGHKGLLGCRAASDLIGSLVAAEGRQPRQ